MRKTTTVVIPLENRDKGKTFEITEMGAIQGEAWAFRALLLVGASGVNMPTVAGMEAIARVGLTAIFQVPYERAKPLLDEMLDCIVYVTDPSKGLQRKIDTSPDSSDIEEVSTLLYLRSEVFELHTGFSPAAALSNLIAEMTTASNTESTQTSPP